MKIILYFLVCIHTSLVFGLNLRIRNQTKRCSNMTTTAAPTTTPIPTTTASYTTTTGMFTYTTKIENLMWPYHYYDPTKTYMVNDLAEYEGYIYSSRGNYNVGNDPILDDLWQIRYAFASNPQYPAYDPEINYPNYASVSFDNLAYKGKTGTGNSGNEPPKHPLLWESLGDVRPELFVDYTEVHGKPESIAEADAWSYLQNLGLTEDKFEELFPNRHGDKGSESVIYTYGNFIRALAYYPTFINANGEADTSVIDTKRELAAFLGMVSALTTKTGYVPTDIDPVNSVSDYPDMYNNGLYLTVNNTCESDNTCNNYCIPSPAYPERWDQVCHESVNFIPRGPFMLSYNLNYGLASNYLNLGNTLIDSPESLELDGFIGFTSSMQLWMNAPQNRPSMHSIITNEWTPSSDDLSQGRGRGFGSVMGIHFNFKEECGKDTDEDFYLPRIAINYYRIISMKLGLPDPKGSITDDNNIPSATAETKRVLGCNKDDKQTSLPTW